MADYIDRGKAVSAACEGADAWDGGSNASRDKYLAEAIWSVPPADVVEVRYGKWIDERNKRGYGMTTRCSACRERSGIGGIESNRHKPFCPNCGARMIGVVKLECLC